MVCTLKDMSSDPKNRVCYLSVLIFDFILLIIILIFDNNKHQSEYNIRQKIINADKISAAINLFYVVR